MFSNRLLRLAGAGFAAVLVSGAVVAITASAAGLPVVPFAASPSPKASASPSTRQQACDDFMNHFASNLGKKPADVQSAGQKAFGQTVDDQVKAGKLTQQQGDALKQKFASGQLCSGLGKFDGPAPGNRPGPGMARGFGERYLADAAKALGMSESDLQSQLRSGKSLKDIAASKNMDEAAFRTAFIAAVKSDLDQQVASGKMTSAQEQAALAKLQTAPLPFWNGMPMRPAGPRPTPSPSSSTT